METALALAVVAHGAQAADRMLEYIVSGEFTPLFDGLPIDWRFGPDDGWVV
jgi:hypothetical protein